LESKNITKIAILAALYVAIGLAIPFISFGAIQCRVSDALYPLIVVLGTPALIGLTIGHFVYNIYGYSVGAALGLLDVVVSPLIFLVAKVAIWKWGYKAVPLHVIAVALWVPYLLNSLFGMPYWPLVVSVGIGEFIAEIVLGIPLAKLVEKRI
jgi:uncharacterized membrane protein